MNPTRMKRLISILFLATVPGLGLASGGGHAQFDFKPDLGNEASLQRGAAAYVNYCLGCHSLKYVRYNRLAQDLGIPEELVMKHLAPADAKPGDTLLTTLPAKESAVWYGRTPPDLSLVARSRGMGWLYSYLLSFYIDPGKPTGVNNLMLPGLSMPHVLGSLQGYQTAHFKEEAKTDWRGRPELDSEGKPITLKVFEKFTLDQPGRLNEKEYQEFVGDLTNFLVYAAEPARMVRIGLGAKVLLYLLLFTGVAYLLKREYWKDVH